MSQSSMKFSQSFLDEELAADLQRMSSGRRVSSVRLQKLRNLLPNFKTFLVVPEQLVDASGVEGVHLQEVVDVFGLLSVDDGRKGMLTQVDIQIN